MKLVFPRDLIAEVAAEGPYAASEIIGTNRHWPVLRLRQAIAFTLKTEYGTAHTRIAPLLGWADHTSSIHAQRMTEQLLEQQDEIMVRAHAKVRRAYNRLVQRAVAEQQKNRRKENARRKAERAAARRDAAERDAAERATPDRDAEAVPGAVPVLRGPAHGQDAAAA